MPMARGLVSDDHPLCASACRKFVLENSDTVLVLGARYVACFVFETISKR